jgi:hypothetical protein
MQGNKSKIRNRDTVLNSNSKNLPRTEKTLDPSGSEHYLVVVITLGGNMKPDDPEKKRERSQRTTTISTKCCSNSEMG